MFAIDGVSDCDEAKMRFWVRVSAIKLREGNYYKLIGSVGFLTFLADDENCCDESHQNKQRKHDGDDDLVIGGEQAVFGWRQHCVVIDVVNHWNEKFLNFDSPRGDSHKNLHP